MRKLLAILLAFTMIFSLVGCGKENIESDIDDFDDFTYTEEDENIESEVETSQNSPTDSIPTNNNSSGSTTIIEKKLSIKEGNKPLEASINLKGKKITYGYLSMADDVKRCIKAFEKKYGCEVELVKIDFGQFTQQVASYIATGKDMDIVNFYGYDYPNNIIANLLEPLQDGFTTADIYNPSKPADGGIDFERSKNMAWNNNLYGVATRSGLYSAGVEVIFYNKNMLKTAGCKDPRTLYNEGKWNWDAMYEIGKKVTDADKGIYLGKANLVLYTMVNYNGGEYVVFDKNGAPVENTTDKKIFNALKYLQKMCSGQNKVIDIGDYSINGESFYEGKNAFYLAGTFNYYNNYNIAEGVLSSNEFGKSLDNLGIVPFPIGPDNDTGKPASNGWIEGWATTKGSTDKSIVLAWAKFVSTYNDPVKKKHEFKKEDAELISNLKNKIDKFSINGFSDSTKTVHEYVRSLEEAVAKGEDISQNLTTYRKVINKCITTTMKQQ